MLEQNTVQSQWMHQHSRILERADLLNRLLMANSRGNLNYLGRAHSKLVPPINLIVLPANNYVSPYSIDLSGVPASVTAGLLPTEPVHSKSTNAWGPPPRLTRPRRSPARPRRRPCSSGSSPLTRASWVSTTSTTTIPSGSPHKKITGTSLERSPIRARESIAPISRPLPTRMRWASRYRAIPQIKVRSRAQHVLQLQRQICSREELYRTAHNRRFTGRRRPKDRERARRGKVVSFPAGRSRCGRPTCTLDPDISGRTWSVNPWIGHPLCRDAYYFGTAFL